MKKFYQNGVIVTDGVMLRDLGILVEEGRIVDLLPSAPEDCESVDLG